MYFETDDERIKCSVRGCKADATIDFTFEVKTTNDPELKDFTASGYEPACDAHASLVEAGIKIRYPGHFSLKREPTWQLPRLSLKEWHALMAKPV